MLPSGFFAKKCTIFSLKSTGPSSSTSLTISFLLEFSPSKALKKPLLSSHIFSVTVFWANVIPPKFNCTKPSIDKKKRAFIVIFCATNNFFSLF